MSKPLRHAAWVVLVMLSMSACQKVDDEDYSAISAASKGQTATGSAASTAGSGGNAPGQAEGEATSMELDGHVAIAKLGAIENVGVRLMLVSLQEWKDIPSAKSTSGEAGEAEATARSYNEKGLTGWRIPTKSEAKMLCNIYRCIKPQDIEGNEPRELSQELLQLNAGLASQKGTPMAAWDNYYKPYRYLCEDAEYTFSFCGGTTVSQAGAKSRYALRLVKDTIVTSQEQTSF